MKVLVRSYNPRFNNGRRIVRDYGGYGDRPQRSYGNRSYNNEGGEQRSSYNPRFNNNNGGRPQRPYTPRFNNNQEGGEQRSYRPRFNNAQQGGEQRRIVLVLITMADSRADTVVQQVRLPSAYGRLQSEC